MMRWATAAFVLFLVACGGGSTGNDPVPPPPLTQLFPASTTPTDTVYVYDVTKTVSHGSPGVPENSSRSFHVGHAGALDTIARFFGFSSPGVPVLDTGAATTWSARGLEAVAFGSLNFNSMGGPCVTVTTPGLLVIPTAFQPGQTHSCSIPSLLDQIDITWVGAEAAPGHPDAQRMTFVVEGPYTSGVGFRTSATRVKVTGVIHVVPGIGPVDGTTTEEFFNAGGVVETRAYSFGNLVIQPAP